MDSKHYEIVFDLGETTLGVNMRNHQNSNSEDRDGLRLLQEICYTIINEDIYPSDWSDLLVLRNRIILNTLRNIADRISKRHLKNFESSYKIWKDYFDTIVTLITDASLKLESFTQTKRNNILAKYNDMRIEGAFELRNMWYCLGDNKKHFIPNMMDSYLKVALIPIKEINDEIIPLFFDMMFYELYEDCLPNQLLLNGNQCVNEQNIFNTLKVPNQLITQLDLHLANGSGNYQFRDSLKRM